LSLTQKLDQKGRFAKVSKKSKSLEFMVEALIFSSKVKALAKPYRMPYHDVSGPPPFNPRKALCFFRL